MLSRDTDLVLKKAFANFPRDFSLHLGSQRISPSLSPSWVFPISNCVHSKVMISDVLPLKPPLSDQ